MLGRYGKREKEGATLIIAFHSVRREREGREKAEEEVGGRKHAMTTAAATQASGSVSTNSLEREIAPIATKLYIPHPMIEGAFKGQL